MIPLLLRLGGSPSTTQGGYRTPLPGWNAGAITSTTQGGFRTPLPFWLGGATAAAVVEDELPQTWDRFHSQAMREDEEMLLLFASFIEVISCRR